MLEEPLSCQVYGYVAGGGIKMASDHVCYNTNVQDPVPAQPWLWREV